GNGSDGRITLPAVVDLLQAGMLKAQLERGLASGCGMTITASAVQRVSSPCLQVLAAGVSAFEKAGGPSLTIADPSPAFLETVSMLGLTDALRLA
ncbi:MAG TPA: STAS domain-containing protein, partial [Rhizomicrobium sp.]